MTVYEAILARRSVRNYLDKPVENEKVDILLKAAMAAPSACNLQPWEFIVVNEPEQMNELRSALRLGKYNAPLSIVVCGISKHIPWEGKGWLQDCGGAAQNIMVECVELGLGSVCIGGFDEELLKRLLEIPDDVYPMCVLEIGYPEYTPAPRTWYDETAVYYGKYDKNRSRSLRTMEMLRRDVEAGIL